MLIKTAGQLREEGTLNKKAGGDGHTFLPDTKSPPVESDRDGAGHLHLVCLLFEHAECH